MNRTCHHLSLPRSTPRSAHRDKSPAHAAFVVATTMAFDLDRRDVTTVVDRKAARQRIAQTRRALASMTEALELLLVELSVETALAADDNQDETATLEAIACTGLADLISVGDGLIDDAAPTVGLLDKCTAARSKLLDLGLGLETSIAELTRCPSALEETRRLVGMQRCEADYARRLLGKQLLAAERRPQQGRRGRTSDQRLRRTNPLRRSARRLRPRRARGPARSV